MVVGAVQHHLPTDGFLPPNPSINPHSTTSPATESRWCHRHEERLHLDSWWVQWWPQRHLQELQAPPHPKFLDLRLFDPWETFLLFKNSPTNAGEKIMQKKMHFTIRKNIQVWGMKKGVWDIGPWMSLWQEVRINGEDPCGISPSSKWGLLGL